MARKRRLVKLRGVKVGNGRRQKQRDHGSVAIGVNVLVIAAAKAGQLPNGDGLCPCLSGQKFKRCCAKFVR